MQIGPTLGGGATNCRSRNRLVWVGPASELVPRSSLLSLTPFPHLIASLYNVQNSYWLAMKNKYGSKHIMNLKKVHEFEKTMIQKDHRLKNIHGFEKVRGFQEN